MSRRYVVIGAGAVGALLAAQLELAGIPAVLVARGPHLAAIRAGGLRVRRPHATETVRLDTAAGPDEVRLSTQDVLVLATKAQDAEGALAQWAGGPDALQSARFRLTVEPVPGHTPGRASTWQSFARGVSSEIDHLNGEIVRLGRRYGVPTPLNERLQRLLGPGEPPGTHRVADLLQVNAGV